VGRSELNSPCGPGRRALYELVATVGTTGVRFCYPTTGADFPITADNVHYDMLRSALLAGKTVEVGVYSFGLDPQAGAEKNCIDRVILRE